MAPGADPLAEAARLGLTAPSRGRSLALCRVCFVLTTLYFGTRGGYYDSDDYDGNGTAH
ncbi:MAG: hypothetical protein NTW83_05900 [Cyanobacteria bacterium]|nr:hypothetical protein [Cyanobacteriota bacterium]